MAQVYFPSQIENDMQKPKQRRKKNKIEIKNNSRREIICDVQWWQDS